MKRQTVKFGKLRAENDPDRGDASVGRKGCGVHYGVNLPRRKGWELGPYDPTCNTRGSCA